MSYCKNCGRQLDEGENFCKNCGTKQDVAFDDVFDANRVNSTPYYDDTPPRQLSKGLQTFIKILLIIAIVAVLWEAGKFLIEGLQLSSEGGIQAIIDELVAADPDMAEVFSMIDAVKLEKVVNTVIIVGAIFALIPLCWILPMRKKILKAMKEGTTLTTGFKVCTLIFVNLILGIVLLCQKDI